MTSRQPEPKPPVWLILAKVEVIAKNPSNLTSGSQALIQCFVPEADVEVAIASADHLLAREGMRRIGMLSQTRFDPNGDLGDQTPDFVKRDILKAASTGKPMTGTVFISKQSASLKS